MSYIMVSKILMMMEFFFTGFISLPFMTSLFCSLIMHTSLPFGCETSET